MSRTRAKKWAGKEWTLPRASETAGANGSINPAPRCNWTDAMAKWSQFELWVQTGENKWEMIGVFPDAELPTTLAKSRARRARLIEVRYDGSKMLGQEVIAEIGTGGKDT